MSNYVRPMICGPFKVSSDLKMDWCDNTIIYLFVTQISVQATADFNVLLDKIEIIFSHQHYCIEPASKFLVMKVTKCARSQAYFLPFGTTVLMWDGSYSAGNDQLNLISQVTDDPGRSTS